MMHIEMERLEMREDWPPGKLEHLKKVVREEATQQIRTPEKWREDLCKAEKELRNAKDSKTRSAIFAKYSYLWSDVKEYYRELSDDKCWYCETSTHRMPCEIDHYRPKAGVTGTQHPGYWWLGFDWRNWRFVCKYCNSQFPDHETGLVGGKGNHFPLLDGEKCRVANECEYEDLLEEDPLLLDPTVRRDIGLLTFTRDGLPSPAVEAEASIDYQRAKESIKVYHLHHSRLNKARRKIYIQVRKLVHQYQRFQTKWEIERDRSAQTIANSAIETLGRLISRDKEYSMTARAYLKEYRRDSPNWKWVDDLLTAS